MLEKLLTTLVQICFIRAYANQAASSDAEPGRAHRVSDDEVTCHVEGES